MTKGSRIMIIILFSFLIINCKQKPSSQVSKSALNLDLKRFDWIIGAWAGGENGDLLFQYWSKKNDTVLLAENLIVKENDTLFYHDIVIKKGKEIITLEIRPKQELEIPARYHIIVNNNGEQVFENTDIDFPQRVIFVLNTDGSLYYRLEGTIEGQPQYEDFILYKSE